MARSMRSGRHRRLDYLAHRGMHMHMHIALQTFYPSSVPYLVLIHLRCRTCTVATYPLLALNCRSTSLSSSLRATLSSSPTGSVSCFHARPPAP
jgi:hypothetical protein